MNDSEYKVHMSLWAIMAAPLIAGNDLRNMSQATRNVLVNERVVAIDQDPLGVQGVRIRDNGDQEVWVKPLATPGQRAVALVNRGGSNASMTVSWSEIGLAGGNAGVLDVWKLIDNGPTPDAFTATVNSHGVVLLIVSGSEPAAPTGTVYVSDLALTHTSNWWGPVERDKSNGEQGGNDGKPIKLSGITYGKGLGVHAGSLVRVNLGGHCSTFTAKIGIDDEVGDKGSVVFEVWSGAERLYTSGLLTGASPMESVSVDVTGKADLRLVVLAGFDNADYDHADWADAQLTCN
jgi:alpha-galactosidase